MPETVTTIGGMFVLGAVAVLLLAAAWMGAHSRSADRYARRGE